MGTSNVIFKRIIITLIAVAAIVITYIYFSQIFPIILAFIIALTFEPFVRFLQRKFKWKKRILPVLITFLSFLVGCGLLIYIAIVVIFDIVYDWAFQIPRYAMQIEIFIESSIQSINQFIQEFPLAYILVQELETLSSDFMQTAIGITTSIITGIGSFVQNLVAAIPNLIFVLLFFLISLFLFSLELPRVKKIFFDWFKSDFSAKLQVVTKRMGEVFLGYWKAQLILSIGIFVLSYIALLFISPNVALIMSVVIWVVDIIPLYVGPALVLVPWGLIALILGSTFTGIQLIVLAIVLLVIRRIVEPKVLGDSIGLAALPTVLSMYFGYVIGGVIGLIIGPFVYIAFITAKEAGLFEMTAKELK
ncbi:sporulation integral membrane protein YtvI [Oceanobacillus sp. CAU 1775]